MTNSGRDYSGWTQEDEIFKSLRDIREFRATVKIPPLELPESGSGVDRLINGLYEQLSEVVREAGFFHADQLRPMRDSGKLGVTYDDDEFGFDVEVSEGQIAIRRPGSRLESFFDWYVALMPSAEGIVSTVQSILQEDHGVQVPITRGSYSFSFLAHELSRDKMRVRNSAVMAQLVKYYPGVDGRIKSLDDSPDGSESDDEIGRVDFKFSRWVEVHPDVRRAWWYTVEAPGNKRWSSLWFSFEYAGLSHTAPDGSRYDFDSTDFLNEWEDALDSFLRDSALRGFVSSILDKYDFESTFGRIP